jgi:hypothetical protein
MPGLAPEGNFERLPYDSLDRLTALSTPVSSYTYQLGPVGNRKNVTEGTGRTVNYNYDGIYRLTNETVSADPAKVNGSVSYVLDPVGNRKSATSTLSGVNTASFNYNTDDELTTERYDANGNAWNSGGNYCASCIRLGNEIRKLTGSPPRRRRRVR